MIKSKFLYVSVFPVLPVIAIITLMTTAINGPEELIIGEWEETSWRYEKMDHSQQSEITWMEEIDDLVKKEIGNHLIIHEAETWNFSLNRKLKLTGKSGTGRTISWNLKGRGNILELIEPDGMTESYIIQELTNDQMILHFNSDLQVRGIVEMKFRKREK